jgi:excisionase family DNA binding protein
MSVNPPDSGTVDNNRQKPTITVVFRMGIFCHKQIRDCFMPADQGSSVFTIEELSQYLKTSKSTLYKLAQDGNIPGQKVGKHWRFHKDAIDQWLQQRNPKSSSPK